MVHAWHAARCAYLQLPEAASNKNTVSLMDFSFQYIFTNNDRHNSSAKFSQAQSTYVFLIFQT